ncbi:MAG TPA: tetratricopeptide repeat protein, partial [Solirubrobacteraceae bacterium]|nr:tetratricopeptide repeat protein [Solirubrobacteraceae bacterium]
MARGKKSKSRVVRRQGGAVTPPATAQAPTADVALEERAPDAPSAPPEPPPAGTVKQPIFGGEDRILRDPQQTPEEARAQRDQEMESHLADLRRVLANSLDQRGPDHPGTLHARADIAMALWQAGRNDEAIELEEELVEDTARVHGEEHPEALTARSNLAST